MKNNSTKRRAYVVEEDGESVRYVEGVSKVDVLRHVTRDRINIRVATQGDFIEAMRANIPLESTNDNEESDDA